jgi:hypothetical protein
MSSVDTYKEAGVHAASKWKAPKQHLHLLMPKCASQLTWRPWVWSPSCSIGFNRAAREIDPVPSPWLAQKLTEEGNHNNERQEVRMASSFSMVTEPRSTNRLVRLIDPVRSDE